MTEWKEYKLGEIVSIASGFAYKGEYIGKGENLLLGMGCVSYKEKFLLSGARPYAGDCAERYYAKVGDIVLATRQQSDNLPILGMPAIIPEDLKDKKLIIGANLYRVTNNSDFDNKYIYWLLKTPDYVRYIASCKTGTTVAMITKSDIENFAFVAPDKSGRERILKIMDSLDDKIDLLHRENKTLETMAETLFRQWFIEEAKEDWEEVSLEDIAYLSAGGDKPKNVSYNRTNELNIPIYSNGIEDEGLYGYTNIPKITEESVTISARGTIGYVVLRTEPFVPIVRLITLTPKKNITSKYLYFWAKSQDINGTGTTQQQLTIPDFKLTKVLLPEKELISKFTNEVDKYYEKILLNKQKIQTLTQQRDGLLPKLMSGKVKI